MPPTMAIQRSHPTVEAQEQYNLGWQDGNEGCACVSGALIMLRGCEAPPKLNYRDPCKIRPNGL